MLELFKAIGLGLMALLPLANPLTTLALFLSLSKNMTPEERNQQSLLTSFYVFIIMIVVFYAGTLVMKTFGISLQGLRIAGGLIVSFIGFRMLFPDLEQTNEIENQTKDKIKNVNIAFVPLAMPSTTGPGTIAMIISWVSTIKEGVYFAPWITKIAPILVFLTVSLIVWGVLRSSGAIMRFIGANGIKVISQLMGFLLVCMGVQFIINGMLEVLVQE
ncbi:MarC family NAAT transporter [Candidatus Palibaumannia cicadellinicola]|nr:MarC family NAAT transporter [Candidatus Baumannia cicadellinicola]